MTARVRQLAMAHPVAGAWILGGLLAAMAYRHLAGASPLSGGAIASFPSSASGFFSEFVSGIRHTPLGGDAPGSPALPMLGVASVLSLGNTAFVQKAMLLALPLFAAVTCHRALRVLPVGRVSAVVGAACYALSATSLWSLSEGRLPEMVFLVGLPWLVTRLVQAFAPQGKRSELRFIVGAGLGIAALTAFLPGTLLAVPLVVAVAFAIPAGGERIAGLIRAALGAAVGVALSYPVLIGVIDSGGAGLSDQVGAPSFADALRLALAPAPGSWRVAFFLPIAAALGLALAGTRLGRPALRAGILAVAGVYLTWAAGAHWLPEALSNPVVYAGVAAFAMCSLAAIGLQSVLTELPRSTFGARHLGSVVMLTVLGAGLIGQTFQAARGAWAVGGPERIPAASAVVSGPATGPYRILWIGRRLGGALPPPGGVAQGRANAGDASVRYAVTTPAGASALDFGRSPDGHGSEALDRTLSAILTGPTRHAGALLAPFAIRYVVADLGDLPAPAAARLGEQADLVSQGAGSLVIYRDPVSPPLPALLPDEAWAEAAPTDDLTTIAELTTPRAQVLDGNGQVLHGTAAGGSSKGLVLLPSSFVPSWTLSASDGTTARAEEVFGWATGFVIPLDAGRFTVAYGGQAGRTAEVLVVSLLWLAALWITRRPSRST